MTRLGRSFLRPGLGALVGVMLLAAPASAQREWSLQKFRPAVHSLGSFTVEAARVSHDLTMNAFLMFNYAAGMLQGANGKDVVDGFGTTDLVASIGFLDHLSFGFDVPVIGPESGTFLDGGKVSQAGVGDIRLSLKATAVKPWRIGPGIGLGLDFMLPTGSKGGYAREEGVTLMPKILIDAVTRHVHLMTNIFFLARMKSFKPDQSSVDFDDDLALSSEAGIATALSIFLGSTDFRMNIEGRFESRLARFFEPENTQLEFTWGLHWKHSSGFAVGGGASFGVLPGYGDPDWRMFLQVGYQPGEYLPMPTVILDADGDGILDDVDQCPHDPEDKDGFQDEDGCPDPDNDGDGILDVNDKCPNEAEDFDGFQDEDGCPDPDNDGDGIPDKVDKCPDQAEDFNGFQDEDGCPDGDGDSDGDGIPDKDDKCPTVPEDFNGFEDEDGCPDATKDSDGDGIPDFRDKCPTVPEDFNGFEDEDGCPDASKDSDGDGIPDFRDKCPSEPEDFDGCEDEDGCPESGRVCVTKEKITISEKVFFATGKATIQARSFSLLDEVAKVLNDNKQVKLVEVQGHTDSRGNDDFNMKLSDARARSVYTYLIGRGVDPSRLTAHGYGEERPIGDNNTSVGREMNRRVEFVILKRDEAE